MKKLKILQFPITKHKNGITHYILNHWNFIDKASVQFDFVSRNPLPYEKDLRQSGAQVHYISYYSEENEAAFCKEMGAILRKGYDVIQLHTSSWKNFIVEELAHQAGVPKIVVHAHSTYINLSDKAEREAAAARHEMQKHRLTPEIATDFWACSDLAADWLYGDRIPRDTVRLMHNAIDTEKYAFRQEVRDTYRKKWGMEDAFVIGCVGCLSYQKNQQFLLEVFKQISQKRKNAKLLLVGEGPMRQELEAWAAERNLTERVVFTGYREDTAQLFQMMDVFCLPSHFEGLPIVGIEAQTVGLYCLFSDQITSQTILTERAKRLPLEHGVWAAQLLELAEKAERGKPLLTERSDSLEAIRQAGYDIRQAVRVMEAAYQEK